MLIRFFAKTLFLLLGLLSLGVGVFLTAPPLQMMSLQEAFEVLLHPEGRALLWPLLTVVMGSYLMGSIPFGFVLTKLLGKGDLRTVGSGNIGATNVLRTGHKTLAALTLLCDGLKGAVCVLFFQSDFFRALGGQDLPSLFLPSFLSGPLPLEAVLGFLAATAALGGHLYPLWLSYKGGKGIATLAGVLGCLSWPTWIFAVSSWGLIFWRTRISSLAALSSLVLTSGFGFLRSYIGEGRGPQGEALTLWLVGVSGVLMVRHRGNIKRLIAGQEGQIGRSS